MDFLIKILAELSPWSFLFSLLILTALPLLISFTLFQILTALSLLLFLNFLKSNNTSIKWILTLRTWGSKFWTWMLDCECVWGREQAGGVPFIGGTAAGRPTKWWGRPAPHGGQLVSSSSRYFLASWLSENGWSSVQIQWRHDLSGDEGANGGDGGDRSDG